MRSASAWLLAAAILCLPGSAAGAGKNYQTQLSGTDVLDLAGTYVNVNPVWSAHQIFVDPFIGQRTLPEGTYTPAALDHWGYFYFFTDGTTGNEPDVHDVITGQWCLRSGSKKFYLRPYLDDDGVQHLEGNYLDYESIKWGGDNLTQQYVRVPASEEAMEAVRDARSCQWEQRDYKTTLSNLGFGIFQGCSNRDFACAVKKWPEMRDQFGYWVCNKDCGRCSDYMKDVWAATSPIIPGYNDQGEIAHWEGIVKDLLGLLDVSSRQYQLLEWCWAKGKCDSVAKTTFTNAMTTCKSEANFYAFEKCVTCLMGGKSRDCTPTLCNNAQAAEIHVRGCDFCNGKPFSVKFVNGNPERVCGLAKTNCPMGFYLKDERCFKHTACRSKDSMTAAGDSVTDITCKPCSVGYFSITGDDRASPFDCKPCPIGTYQDGTSATSCKAHVNMCPPNKTAAISKLGRASDEATPAGGCKECPANQSVITAESVLTGMATRKCVQIDWASFGNFEVGKICPAGTYVAEQPGRRKEHYCVTCPADEFSTVVNAFECASRTECSTYISQGDSKTDATCATSDPRSVWQTAWTAYTISGECWVNFCHNNGNGCLTNNAMPCFGCDPMTDHSKYEFTWVDGAQGWGWYSDSRNYQVLGSSMQTCDGVRTVTNNYCVKPGDGGTATYFLRNNLYAKICPAEQVHCPHPWTFGNCVDDCSKCKYYSENPPNLTTTSCDTCKLPTGFKIEGVVLAAPTPAPAPIMPAPVPAPVTDGAAPTPAPIMPAPDDDADGHGDGDGDGYGGYGDGDGYGGGVADLVAFLKTELFNASSCAASALTRYDYHAINKCVRMEWNQMDEAYTILRIVGSDVFVDKYLNSNCTGPYASQERASTTCSGSENKYRTHTMVSLPYMIYEEYSNSSCAGTLESIGMLPVGVCESGDKSGKIYTCDAGIASEIRYSDEFCTHGATLSWSTGGCIIINGTPTQRKIVACTKGCVPFIMAVENEGVCKQCTSFPCVWEPCSAQSPRVCSSTEADKMGALAI